MNLNTVATVLVVLSCIASVGVASTTLETSLSTNPDDVVDLDYDTVPISPDTAGDLERAMTGQGSEGAAQASNGDGDGQGRADGAAGNQQSQSKPSDERAQEQRSQSGELNEQQSRSEPQSEGARGTDATRDWLDVLLDFVETLVPLFVALAALLGAAVLLARYGDRVLRWFRDDPARREATGPLRPEPRNAVERAWASVLAAADVEDPWRRTTEECASAAVESGFDPEGIERVRRVFEEVRYGGREVTDARVRRAERGLSRLGDGWDGEEVRR